MNHVILQAKFYGSFMFILLTLVVLHSADFLMLNLKRKTFFSLTCHSHWQKFNFKILRNTTVSLQKYLKWTTRNRLRLVETNIKKNQYLKIESTYH